MPQQQDAQYMDPKTFLQWCGWLNDNPPEDVHALIPEPVNTLPSMVKGTLKEWLRVCTLRWKSNF